jgi:N6-adenosine-specific RNA methylase IME4/ParB-like chromosome segregation protein Spo0J
MELPIDEIVVGERCRKEMGDISALAKSIEEIGLLHPIVITPKRQLVVGARRLEAIRQLGWSEIPTRTIESLDELWERRSESQENFCRKDFVPEEFVALGEILESLERQAAKKRQARPGKERSGKLPEREKGDAREIIGAAIGVSGKTYEKAKAVVAKARAKPKEFGDLLTEMNAKGNVSGAFRKLVIREKAQAIAKEPSPLPEGPFRVIVCDPPWHYEKRAGDVTQRGAIPYPSMTIPQIRALPVESRAHDDAVLWLWATNAHLPEAFGIVEAWGFRYKTLLTWAKQKMGMGDWLRGQTEHCLMAVRGKPVVILTNQTTLLNAPTTKHSAKPAEFYELVERLCPGSKLEMFQRKPREGWFGHGDESTESDNGKGRRILQEII